MVNAATLEVLFFQNAMVIKLCLEQESTECKCEVVGDIRRNQLIIGSGISWLLGNSVNHGPNARGVLKRSGLTACMIQSVESRKAFHGQGAGVGPYNLFNVNCCSYILKLTEKITYVSK